MKIEKKHIIIAIIAAVAIYLLWKRGVFGGGSDNGSSSGDDDTDTSGVNSVNSIIAKSGMTNADASYVRRWVRQKENNLSEKARIEQKAEDNGYTYAQQAVLDALWTKYYKQDDTGAWVFDTTAGISKDALWKIQQYVMNM